MKRYIVCVALLLSNNVSFCSEIRKSKRPKLTISTPESQQQQPAVVKEKNNGCCRMPTVGEILIGGACVVLYCALPSNEAMAHHLAREIDCVNPFNDTMGNKTIYDIVCNQPPVDGQGCDPYFRKNENSRPCNLTVEQQRAIFIHTSEVRAKKENDLFAARRQKEANLRRKEKEALAHSIAQGIKVDCQQGEFNQSDCERLRQYGCDYRGCIHETICNPTSANTTNCKPYFGTNETLPPCNLTDQQVVEVQLCDRSFESPEDIRLRRRTSAASGSKPLAAGLVSLVAWLINK